MKGGEVGLYGRSLGDCVARRAFIRPRPYDYPDPSR